MVYGDYLLSEKYSSSIAIKSIVLLLIINFIYSLSAVTCQNGCKYSKKVEIIRKFPPCHKVIAFLAVAKCFRGYNAFGGVGAV